MLLKLVSYPLTYFGNRLHVSFARSPQYAQTLEEMESVINRQTCQLHRRPDLDARVVRPVWMPKNPQVYVDSVDGRFYAVCRVVMHSLPDASGVQWKGQSHKGDI